MTAVDSLLMLSPLTQPDGRAAALQRPFLKWAGGKFKIIDRILAALPPGGRLLEPFLGSGAVFLNCKVIPN